MWRINPKSKEGNPKQFQIPNKTDNDKVLLWPPEGLRVFPALPTPLPGGKRGETGKEMTVVSCLRKRLVRFSENGDFPHTPGPSPRRGEGRRLLDWLLLLLLLLLLAGLPILVHGCHRDEDNELFVPLVRHDHERGTID
jgi:hypothetical protein